MERERLKISVVTISYNQGEYLKQCLESVAAQEGPWEHIIVDAGSTDCSREIIEMSASQFSKIIFESDFGPADGLNKGFSYANGDVFYYLNSDDVVFPGAFRSIREIMNQYPEVDVVSGGGYILDEDGTKTRRLWSDPVSRLGLAFGGSVLIQPSTFIRKRAFTRTGNFNVSNRSNWDGEMVIDLFLSGATFKQVNLVWSGFRLHKSSITGSAREHDAFLKHRAKMLVKLEVQKVFFRSKFLPLWFRLKRTIKHPSRVYQRLRYGPVYAGKK